MNVWQAMENEAEAIALSSHCEKCLSDYDKGRLEALREWAPKVHEREIEWAGELARQRDEMQAKIDALEERISYANLPKF